MSKLWGPESLVFDEHLGTVLRRKIYFLMVFFVSLFMNHRCVEVGAIDGKCGMSPLPCPAVDVRDLK